MARTPTAGALLLILIAAPLMAGCLGGTDGDKAAPLQQAGSSTVFPIAASWAEELAAEGLQVTVSGGGSGRGASLLCAGEIDIADMSRDLKASEVATCRANGIEPVAWKVAFDGITVVLNSGNDFVDHLTVEELRHIWRADSPARTWADVRAGWPAETIILYGPDTDSGTFEYFNEEILGKDCGADGKAQCPIRTDFTPSPDDNVLVEGVAASRYAIGHFGFSYYIENSDRLKAASIAESAEATPVAPTFETIADGSYVPLSRPLFMVTDGVPAAATSLHTYLSFAFGDGQGLVRGDGYVELDAATLAAQRAKL